MTPFGRQSLTRAHLSAREVAQTPPALPEIDKYSILNDLRDARAAFGLTDRDLGVLYGLLSFLPARKLVDDAMLIVHPSNASLSDRVHGMAESTLRRHLASLVRAGVILRHDSPNGKRYVARTRGGDVQHAFGFDLRPLLARASEISAAAEAARDAALTFKREREAVVLSLRDAAKLAAYGMEAGLDGDWAEIDKRLAPIRRALRRKLSLAEVMDCASMLVDIHDTLCVYLSPEVNELSGNADHIERHQQNSNTDSSDFEPCLEKSRGTGLGPIKPTTDAKAPSIPLPLVLKACPDILPYAGDSIRSWHELIGAAAYVRGMMGISLDAWQEAQRVMGSSEAAVVVISILQRVDTINSPGGYLRALTLKAANGAFSSGPMVMALLSSASGRAA